MARKRRGTSESTVYWSASALPEGPLRTVIGRQFDLIWSSVDGDTWRLADLWGCSERQARRVTVGWYPELFEADRARRARKAAKLARFREAVTNNVRH